MIALVRRTTVLLALAACNAPPEDPVVDLTPAAPTTLDDLVADVTADDPNGDEVSLTYTWYRDGTRVAAVEGDTVPAALTERDQTWRVDVTASDGTSSSGIGSATTKIVNAAPSTSVVLDPNPPQAGNDLVATTAPSDPDGDQVGLSFSWTVGGVDAGIEGDTVPGSRLVAGDLWEVTVVPSDGTTQGAPGKASGTVGNGAPVIDSVTFAPDPPQAGVDLVATAMATDPEGDPVILSHAWFVDDEDVGLDDPTLPAGRFGKGDTIRLEITPSDGKVTGRTWVGRDLVVANGVPALGAVTLSPTPIREGTVVTCEAASVSDPDGDDVELSYTWMVDGSPVAARTSTLSGVDFDRDDTVQCTITADDGQGGVVQGSSTSVTVANTPPVVVSASIDTGAPGVGQDLTVTVDEVVDDDGDAIELAYEWLLDGVPVATTEDLPVGSFSRGDNFRVRITPSDDRESGTPFITDEVEVVNSPPEVLQVLLQPSPPTRDAPIAAVVTAADPNDDAITLQYQWSVDGSVVSGATGSSLPPSAFQRGQSVSVVVTPSDTFDTGVPVPADPVTVGNARPKVGSVIIEPPTVTEVTGATCTPLGWSDADGDTEGYLFVWRADGQQVGTGREITGAVYDRGDTLSCTATPFDGTDEGTAATSADRKVGNARPILTGVTLDRAELFEGESVTATAVGLSDPDPADAGLATVRYTWRIGSGIVTGVTGRTLTSAWFDKGDLVSVVATPTDGIDDGIPRSTDAIPVRNSPPAVSTPAIVPALPITTDDLTVDVTIDDPDDIDSPTAVYRWSVNGSVVQTGAAATLSHLLTTRNDTVKVEVQVSDGEATIDWKPSGTVTVANAPPSEPSVQVQPRWSTVGGAPLWCAILSDAEDPDGDTVTYAFSWTVDGASYPRAGDVGPSRTVLLGDTVPSADLGTDEVWTCSVVAQDGPGTSDPAEATARTIAFDLDAVSSGDGYSCGIATDRSARCWGRNDQGQAQPPERSYEQISAGRNAACGVTTADTLVCWGPLTAPPTTSGWAEVGVGVSHACALANDGTISCWGASNFEGELDAPNGSWRDLAVGYFHGCALDPNGEPFCWGLDASGQATPPANGTFLRITAGANFTCGLRKDGEVVCWGDGVVRPVPPGPYVEVVAGGAHVCGIRSDDTMSCWGSPLVDKVPPPGTWARVAPGIDHTCGATTTGELRCWGEDVEGQLQPSVDRFDPVAPGYTHTCGVDVLGYGVCWADPADDKTAVPMSLGTLVDITAGRDHTCAVDTDGFLECWGLSGAAGNGETLHPAGSGFLQVSAGQSHTCALADDGTVACWGLATEGQTTPPDPPTGRDFVQIACGRTHCCARDNGNELSCWGSDVVGESTPPSGTFLDVDGGGDVTCGIRSTEDIACWGNTGAIRDDIPPGTNYDQITVGEAHACALDATRTVTCWGADYFGQLSVPDDDFTSIRAGADHTCGVTVDGRTRCWGRYAY